MNTAEYELLDQLVAFSIGAEYRSGRAKGDGNCQFHSLLAALRAAVLEGKVNANVLAGVNDARSLRARVVDWLQENGGI